MFLRDLQACFPSAELLLCRVFVRTAMSSAEAALVGAGAGAGAAVGAAAPPITFVTGNAKKLEVCLSVCLFVILSFCICICICTCLCHSVSGVCVVPHNLT